MAALIQQGDQYMIPVKIKRNGTEVTPTDVHDVRIKFGNFLKSYLNEEVQYADGVWFFPITEDMSRVMLGQTSFQVGIKLSNESEFIYSPTVQVSVGKSIITEAWHD